MSLIVVASKECQRLRELKHPYLTPEFFPNPVIQSNQVKAALFAVQLELDAIKKQLSKQRGVRNKTKDRQQQR